MDTVDPFRLVSEFRMLCVQRPALDTAFGSKLLSMSVEWRDHYDRLVHDFSDSTFLLESGISLDAETLGRCGLLGGD